MSSLVAGLGANGTFVVIGASPDPIEVSTTLLILGKRTIKGWSAGTPTDSEDTLRFARSAGVRPMIEKLPSGKGRGGVRANDERGGSVPRSLDDGIKVVSMTRQAARRPQLPIKRSQSTKPKKGGPR